MVGQFELDLTQETHRIRQDSHDVAAIRPMRRAQSGLLRRKKFTHEVGIRRDKDFPAVFSHHVYSS